MLPLRDDTFRAIAELMHRSVGLSFGAHKKPLVASRLAPRIARLGLGGYADYLDIIRGHNDQGEFQMAVDLLTTNETYFFREAAHFEQLAQELARERPRRVRVWSAACSFGDEPYSTAIVLSELQQQGRIGDDWSVLGTDISDRVLRSAQQGIYPNERLREVSKERLRRHFLRGEGDAEGLSQVQDALRARVRFGQLNLCLPIEDLGPFDAVFLRNVLIYFDAATKRQVMERMLSQLRVGGLLFTGMAEGPVACEAAVAKLGPGVLRKLGA